MDPLIESLLGENGTELRFETGEPPVLTLPNGPVTPIRKPLGTPQIRSAIAELATGELAETVRRGDPASFPYAHPRGTVLVTVRPDRERVVVLITRGPSASGTSAAVNGPAADGGRATSDSPAGAEPAPAGGTRPANSATRAAPRDDARPGSAATRRHRRPAPERTRARPREEDEHEDGNDDDEVAFGADEAVEVPTDIVLPPSTSMLPHVDAPRTAPAAKAMDALLEHLIDKNASDLHLSTGQPPALRIDGDLRPDPDLAALPLDDLTAMLYSILPARNRKEFERKNDTDCAWENARSRFRVNVFRERQGIGAVIRRIPNEIRSVEDLGLPKHILELCKLPKGLVLVTGPTGSGKSTTLAAMIDFINRTRTDHIITIEDPIEFVHPNKGCVVHQREVGVHTESFKTALRAALREDPDVVLVGEMRDLETVSIAIETAETGHLVFGTLHTNTAPSTVDRIIDQFPADRQAQVRTMLSETLKGVITQTLCKKKGGGRLAVLEILIVNNAISNLIREGKTFQIPSMMQTGRGVGMQTQADTLFDLVEKRKVEPAEALEKAVAKTEFRQMLERAGYRV